MKTFPLAILFLLSIAGCSSATNDENVGAANEDLRRIDTPHVTCTAEPSSCTSGSHAVAHRGLFGCVTVCVVCPEIDTVVCNPNDELVTGKDADGCDYAYCKPPAEPPHP